MQKDAAHTPLLFERTGITYLHTAEGARYASKQDWRRSAQTYREAIALRPDESDAYFNLGAALNNSGHYMEAAQRYLEAKERYLLGSDGWAEATVWLSTC